MTNAEKQKDASYFSRHVKIKFSVAIAVTAVVIIFLFILFVWLLFNHFEGEAASSAVKEASCGVQLLQGRIEDSYDILDRMALAVSSYGDIQSAEALKILSSPLEEVSGGVCMPQYFLVVLPNGNAVLPDGSRLFLGEYSSVQAAVKGERGIARLEEETKGSQHGLCLTVPIYRGTRFVGVLCGEYDQEGTNRLLSFPSAEKGTRTGVITMEGEPITNQKYLGEYHNFFEAIKGIPLYGVDNFPVLRQRVRTGETGVFSLGLPEGKTILGYAPLGIKNWLVIASPPVGIQNARGKDVFWLSTVLILCVCLAMGAMVFYLVRIQYKSIVRLGQRNKEMDILVSSVPGGVVRYLADDSERISFVSDGMLRMFNYAGEEVFRRKFNDRFSNVIHPADRKAVMEEISRQLANKRETIRTQFRVRAKGGRVRWVYACGQIVEDEKHNRWNYIVMVDITDQKEAEEQIRLSEERYRLIMEKTDSIIFEWNILEDTVVFSDVWEKKIGYPPAHFNFYNGMAARHEVHPEDLDTFRKAMDEARNGKSYSEFVARFRLLSDDYLWCRISLTGILDAAGIPCRAVGIAIDIDREKREAESLQFRAERDSLTHIYNKGATEQLIRNWLDGPGKGQDCALLVMDIDNFKGVNDNFGHMCGDALLRSVAEALCSIFRSDDILGRIGGDEFVAFMKNVSAKETVLARAKAIGAAVRDIRVEPVADYVISASIGIALYPRDADSYEGLYRRADAALYSIKRHGKDNCCFYSGDMKVENSELVSSSEIESNRAPGA